MHAYLIVGQSESVRRTYADKIAKSHQAKIIEFPFVVVNDARNIEKFVKLKPTFSTAIMLQNVEGANSESLNALLKVLEERSDYVFILTTKNIQSVIATIVSRCMIVRANENFDASAELEKIDNFFNSSISQKIVHLGDIKTRPEALEFLNNILLHGPVMLERTGNKSLFASYLLKTTHAKKRLLANTNVFLQLLNYAISLEDKAD